MRSECGKDTGTRIRAGNVAEVRVLRAGSVAEARVLREGSVAAAVNNIFYSEQQEFLQIVSEMAKAT